jgi:hypothetical protein
MPSKPSPKSSSKRPRHLLPFYRTPPSNELTLLRRARKIIAAGWCQNSLAENRDRDVLGADEKECTQTPEVRFVCSLGGIYRGVDGGNIHSGVCKRTTNLLAKVIFRETEGRHDGIVGFNDAGSTTKKQVLAMFKKAEADARLLLKKGKKNKARTK